MMIFKIFLLYYIIDGISSQAIVINTEGCSDSRWTWPNLVSYTLSDGKNHVIKCEAKKGVSYDIKFHIKSDETRFKVYFTTGAECSLGDNDYDKDTVTDFDDDPETAKSNNKFYVDRTDYNLNTFSDSTREVLITNYIFTPIKENQLFCFIIEDDMFEYQSHDIEWTFQFQEGGGIKENKAKFSKPLSEIKITGTNLDTRKLGDKSVGFCCVLTPTEDSDQKKTLQCSMEDISSSGDTARIVFNPSVLYQGYIQMSFGVGGTTCPQNYQIIGVVGDFNIQELFTHPVYGPIIIGGVAVVMLFLCWCYQQYQKQRMIKMITQGGNRGGPAPPNRNMYAKV